MEEKELENLNKFMYTANKTIKRNDFVCDFVCPICNGKAKAIRNGYNGHLRAACKQCGISIIQ